jgi:DNA replication protein DnaC
VTDERVCAGGCGRPAPTLEILGQKIAVRYCPDCAERERREQDVRDRAQAEAAALRRAGATERLLELTLETYPEDGQAALQFARGWLERYRAGERQNLWLVGDIGAGKTGLAWGLVRQIVADEIERYFGLDEEFRAGTPSNVALLIVWRDLLDALRAEMNDPTEYDGSTLYRFACNVRVLALDDLGAERPTEYALERLAGLVQARYDARRPTIVTTNYQSPQLAARLGETDKLLGRRIADRLYDGSVGVTLERASRRGRAG